MIKVLIVDDSALMRRQLTQLFESEGDFTVLTARNGEMAVSENQQFEPDVITLDINMPQMDGLTALSIIMNERPVPVVMFSSLTEQGALATFEALNLGAVDYVPKPDGTISLTIDEVRDELIAKVRSAAKAKLKTKMKVAARPERRLEASTLAARITPMGELAQDELVVMGVSTGGPRTLEEVLPQLPADFPRPVLVAQHMPATFTKSFAERLDQFCPLKVVEVNTAMKLHKGHIYIAKGGADMVITRRLKTLMATPKPENPKYLWHPSVELLGQSVLEHCDPRKIIAVMLTGMGHDGADAFAEIHRRGGRTIAESEESAVVYGMPAELVARRGAQMILPAEQIANQLIKWAS
ncbi:MAG: chemotaxis response regulator protein-glutamate methylesterase [Marinagarivorans sp.]